MSAGVKVRRVPNPEVEKHIAELQRMTKAEARVGWFEGDGYPDGTPVAYVASIHEFGAPAQGIPPRPFMRTTIDEKRASWANIARNSAVGILKGSSTVGEAVELLGLKVAGDIRKTISKIQSPPLKQKTIDARKNRASGKIHATTIAKPLVDTRHMVDTLQNVTVSK